MFFSSIVSLLNLLIRALGFVASSFLSLLPSSPFNNFQSLEVPYLSWLNWVMPISFMVTVVSYWVISIGLYYVVQVVLRWVRAIQ